MYETKRTAKAILSIILCFAMVIGFIPEFKLSAGAAPATPTITVTEVHLTNSFENSETHGNTCPSGSVKWTTTGISGTDFSAKIYVSAIPSDGLEGKTYADLQNYWSLAVCENDCGTINEEGGECMGTFIYSPSLPSEPLLPGMKCSVQVVLYKGLWGDQLIVSDWQDAYVDWYIHDPFMTADGFITTGFKWFSTSDYLSDLGEDNSQYDMEIYVWKGWDVAPDPYETYAHGSAGCWLMTVPFVNEEDITTETTKYLTLNGGYYSADLYPAFEGTPPTLTTGDMVSLGFEVLQGGVIIKQSPIVRFTIAEGTQKITQPSLSATEASFTTANLADLTVTKSDGDFTFDSVKKGSSALTSGTDYTVSGSSVTIKKDYLSSLGAGEHTLTFHYTGTAGEDNTPPTDPTLKITISERFSPVLTVTGDNDADITENCTVEWKTEDGVKLASPSVPSGTKLYYTVTPGEALEIGGVQYYETATGNVTITKANQAVSVAPGRCGTVTAVPYIGGTAITDGYTVAWYSKAAPRQQKTTLKAMSVDPDPTDGYTYLSGGKTSPKVKLGTTLYCDITMTGSNKSLYPDIEKAEVKVTAFGNVSKNISLAAKNNITLSISGTDAAGEAIVPADYRVAWYKLEDERYKIVSSEAMLTGLADAAGEKYYYEITPYDRYSDGKVYYNWLRFKGRPVSEATAVTVTDEAQTVNVVLDPVTLVTLSGTVTNGKTIGADNLTFSVTQDPFAGYLNAYSYYSYGRKWSDISFTTEVSGDAVNFTAKVWDLGATLKITEKTGNFRNFYKTISAADIEEPISVTMSAEDLPTSIPLEITQIYPNWASDTGSSTQGLYYGSWSSNEGIFKDMVFTLTNTTKGKVIDPSLYNVTISEVQFTGDVSAVIEMGDTLALSYTIDEIAGEVAQTGDSVKVLKDYYLTDLDWEDRTFNLSYKDLGNIYFTSADGRGTRHLVGAYDENGELVSSANDTYYGWVNSVPPGTYTVVNLKANDWFSLPATLEGFDVLSESEYIKKTGVVVQNGVCTTINFGASPDVGSHPAFTENSKFGEDTVKTTAEEWVLVKLAYEVDPVIAKANPGATYAVTVKTGTGYAGTDTTPIVPRYEARAFGAVQKDKYISLYCDNKLTESTVKINQRDAWHLQATSGFTLYTDKTSGVIWFYVQAARGGDFNITAQGARVNEYGQEVNVQSFGNMTLSVSAASGELNINSDYLLISGKKAYTNNAWLYTTPNCESELYMDGVKIARYKTSGTGIAYFTFQITDRKVGSENISTFLAKDPAWTAAGEHELYAITTKNGTETRSATTTITAVTEQNFTPAVIRCVDVKLISDNEKDPFSGRISNLFNAFSDYGAVGYISNYYYSMNDQGKVFTYEFTATVPDGNNVDTMYVTVTGQDGEEHIAELIRDGDTNKFVGSVSGEKLLFTNWSVSIKSKADITIKGDYIGDEDAFLAAYGNVKINDPETGAEMTVTQYYQQEYDKLVDTYLEEQEKLVQDRQEVLDIFLEGMKQFDDMLEGKNFDYSTFDGSEESMKALMEHFGIYESTYLDDNGEPVVPESVWQPKHVTNKVVWPNGQIIWTDETFEPYAETIGSDGRIIRVTTTEEIDLATRHLICVQYAVGLPLEGVEGDKGYSYIQGLDCGEISDGIAIQLAAQLYPYKSGDVLKKLGGGEEKHFPTMSKNGIQKVGNSSSILNAIHKNVVGTGTQYSKTLAGIRAGLNVGYQWDHRQQTKAEIGAQTAIDGLIESGKLTGENLDLAKSIKDDIDAICKATETADFATAMKIMMDKINIVAESLNEVKEGVTDFIEKGFKDKLKDDLKQKAIDEAKEAIEDKTGITIPTDLKEACMALLDVYASGKLSEAEKRAIELYLKTQALAKKTKTRIPPEAGGNGKNGGSGVTGRSSGGSVRATHDPEGIIYEAVLSNPVEGATATLYERDLTTGDVSQWNAEEYGQINPQETNGSGYYQWFVPEGEWQVRVKAPEGSGLQDNTSADNAAANLDDGSTKGWLPVMPVQLGINIPLTSTAAPIVKAAEITDTYAQIEFSLYMDVSALTSEAFTVKSGDTVIPCSISYPNKDTDPLDETKVYTKFVRLTPANGFDKGAAYTVTVKAGVKAYNDKALAEDAVFEKKAEEKPAPKLESMIVTPPAKTEYFTGERFDETGLTVTAVYDDGTKLDIAEGYEITGYDNKKEGVQTITVTYGEKSGSFLVLVTKKTAVLKEITVEAPGKTEYFIGEELDLTGLKITAAYDDETTMQIDPADAQFSAYDKTKAGKQTITVTYEEKTAEFEVTVKAVELTAVELVSAPAKTEYFTGEELDLTGAKIKAVYSDKTEKEIDVTAEMVTGYDKTKAEKQTITVTYEEKTVTFEVTVEKKKNEYEGERVVIDESAQISDAIKEISKKISDKTAGESYVIVISGEHTEKKALSFPKSDVKIVLLGEEGSKLILSSPKITAKCPLVIDGLDVKAQKEGKYVTVSAYSDFTACGASFGNVTVKGRADLTDVTVNGNLKLSAKADKTMAAAEKLTDVTVTKKVTANNSLLLENCGSFGNLTTKGNLTVSSDGAKTTFANVTVKGRANLSDVTINGSLKLSAKTDKTFASFDTLTRADIKKKVTSNNSIAFIDCGSIGTVSAKGAVTVTGSGTEAVSVTAKAASVKSSVENLTLSKKLCVKGILDVNGSVTAKGAVSAAGLCSTKGAQFTVLSLSITKYGLSEGTQPIVLKLIGKKGEALDIASGKVAVKKFKGAFDPAKLTLGDKTLKLKSGKLYVE